jgi:hypothetical protein
MHKPSGGNDLTLDYEERSIPMGKLAIWMVGLFLGLAGVLSFVFFVYGTPKMRPAVEEVLNRPMNQPTLQSNGYVDMKKFRAEQEEWLSTYGWVNRSSGVVRLPIERAMELIVQRGLPARGGKE